MPSKLLLAGLIAAAGATVTTLSSLSPAPLPTAPSPLTQLANSIQSAFDGLRSQVTGNLPAAPSTASTAALPGFDTPSILNPEEAAATLTALIMGQQLPAPIELELAKFLTDFSSTDPQQIAPEMAAMGEQLAQFLIGTLTAGSNGELPMDRVPNLPIEGLPAGEMPSLDSIYAAYGAATTVSYLMAAYAVPDLAPWALPHNIRVVANQINTKTSNSTSGNAFTPLVTSGVTVGQSFTNTTTLDIDALIATALDQHTVNDVILIQAPLSTSLNITVTCTRVLLNRCAGISTNVATTSNDKVLARDATYTFAYPLNAGQFPTRATATDLFQVAYDAMGSVHAQKPRDPIAASPFVNIPGLEALVPGTGLADLSTQAPAVNFYGFQGADGLLPTPGSFALPTPSADSLPSLDGLSLASNRMGPTAGYRVEEVRAGKTNVMVVRWHNLGTETLGKAIDGVTGQLLGSLNSTPALPLPLPTGALPLPALPTLPTGDLPTDRLPSAAELLRSAPATISYAVPAGAYALTDNRVEGTDNVFATDFAIAGDPPALTLPPKLPTQGDLMALASVLQDLAAGDGFTLPGTDLPLALN